MPEEEWHAGEKAALDGKEVVWELLVAADVAADVDVVEVGDVEVVGDVVAAVVVGGGVLEGPKSSSQILPSSLEQPCPDSDTS